MADLVGFKHQLKKLGHLPSENERVMREAIVAIPFIKKTNKRTSALESQLIPIKKNLVKKANAAIKQGITRKEAKVSESVYNLVSAMKRYVIPPRFDFLKKMELFDSRKIRPFSMYIFEFEHALSRQDVADMWKNLPPDIGTEFKVDEKTICHKLGKNELLSEKQLSDKTLHWLVFKVKQKAKTNYYE